jgi:exosome complex RNA-binding protein Rrp4
MQQPPLILPNTPLPARPTPNPHSATSQAPPTSKIAGLLLDQQDNLTILGSHDCYWPSEGHTVVGVVTACSGEGYCVDVGGLREGGLGALEFEGATKRNRPLL